MITVNITKAKTISHEIRRRKRGEEFAPLDEVIMKQIPGTDVQAIEQQRQEIRDRYSIIQTDIDNAVAVEELTTIVNNL